MSTFAPYYTDTKLSTLSDVSTNVANRAATMLTDDITREINSLDLRLADRLDRNTHVRDQDRMDAFRSLVDELHGRALEDDRLRTNALALPTPLLGEVAEVAQGANQAKVTTSYRSILNELHQRAVVDHIDTLTKTPITRGDANPGDILDGEFVLEVQHHGITRPMTRIRFVAGWEEWLDSSWHISVYR